jgi:mannitol-1-phosphate/altronate dehydrogenase
LTPIAPGFDRAFLVEEFNRILVTRATLPDFTPGIEVFIEKDNLLPFEEAKLYGHNAIHALLGFVGTVKGYVRMPELREDEALMRIARDAFTDESGGALIRKYASLDEDLFTKTGYEDYARDLLERITNPHLGDTVARASRDIVRKLGADDRIFGTMTLALGQGIEPRNMGVGAIAGIALLLGEAREHGLPREWWSSAWRSLDRTGLVDLLAWLWQREPSPALRKSIGCTYDARASLMHLIKL